MQYQDSKNANKIIALAGTPLLLLKEGSKFGIKGIKKLFGIILLFGFTNLLLFIYALFAVIGTGIEGHNYLYLLLILLLGFVFTLFSGYRAYQFVILDAFRVLYSHMSGLFHKISEKLIDSSEYILMKGKQAQQDSSKFVNVSELLQDRYNTTPRLVKNGVQFILKRVPVAVMLQNLKTDIDAGNKEKAADDLYLQMDRFILENIFGGNNTKWVIWLFPLNLIIQLVIIYLKLK